MLAEDHLILVGILIFRYYNAILLETPVKKIPVMIKECVAILIDLSILDKQSHYVHYVH